MASDSHFVIPRLDGILAEYRFHAGERASIRLARTLLEVDIADPTEWRRVRRDPTAYVGLTLKRWIDLHGGQDHSPSLQPPLTLSETVDEYTEAGRAGPGRGAVVFCSSPRQRRLCRSRADTGTARTGARTPASNLLPRVYGSSQQVGKDVHVPGC